MIQDYLEELYDKQALMEVYGELISLPQLKTILKKKSDSSISHLIKSGKMESLVIAGKTYVTKPNLYLYFCPVTESKNDKDYQLDPHYKNFFGLDEEDTVIPKKLVSKIDDTKGKRRILTDDKEEVKNEANKGAIRLRIKN
jgi:hypothetical protein